MRTWNNRHKPTDDGLWHEEPDKAQWVDDTTDLDCLIVRNPLGALCGYVGVPKGHPLYGVDYSDCPDSVDNAAHGELTFSDSCQPGEDESVGICHIPDAGRTDDIWWLGFDCAHSCDYVPVLASRGSVHGGTYRTFAYVQERCGDLARRIAEVAR